MGSLCEDKSFACYFSTGYQIIHSFNIVQLLTRSLFLHLHQLAALVRGWEGSLRCSGNSSKKLHGTLYVVQFW